MGRIIRPYLGDFTISQRYKGAGHQGLDLIGVDKTVIACTSGTIAGIARSCTHNYPKNSSCGCGGGFGNYVLILESDSNNYWWYGHLGSVTGSLKVGQQVKQGDVLGIEGCCGFSTGSHLHIEMRVANVYSGHRNMAELLGVSNADWAKVSNSYNQTPVAPAPQPAVVPAQTPPPIPQKAIAWKYTYSEEVKFLQGALNGYGAGLSVDGIAGNLTNNAARKYTVSYGDRDSSIVTALQKILFKLGYDPKGVDGICGKNTCQAIFDFQKANNLGTATKNGYTYFGGEDWTKALLLL